jgi:hypothetical protein
MKKVMAEERLSKLMDPANMPFEMSRMALAGFAPIPWEIPCTALTLDRSSFCDPDHTAPFLRSPIPGPHQPLERHGAAQ